MPVQPVPSGKVRFTIVMDKDARDDLIKLTEDYDLSQPDVIDALVADAINNKPHWDPLFAAAHDMKVRTRANKRTVIERLAKLDPDRLQALLAVAERHIGASGGA
jgi:hypothetical protein